MMGRGKAAFTEAAVSRILAASRKTGVPVRATLPDGTIIETLPTGELALTAANDNGSVKDFEDLNDRSNRRNPWDAALGEPTWRNNENTSLHSRVR